MDWHISRKNVTSDKLGKKSQTRVHIDKIGFYFTETFFRALQTWQSKLVEMRQGKIYH